PGATGSAVSKATRSLDGGKRFWSQSVVSLSGTAALDRAIARVAATFALKRSSDVGSTVFNRASASGVNDGAVQSCGSSAADNALAMAARLTGWLKRSSTTIRPLTVSPRRYQLVLSSLTVGVVNVNVSGFASLRPLTAVAVVSTVTV